VVGGYLFRFAGTLNGVTDILGILAGLTGWDFIGAANPRLQAGRGRTAFCWMGDVAVGDGN